MMQKCNRRPFFLPFGYHNTLIIHLQSIAHISTSRLKSAVGGPSTPTKNCCPAATTQSNLSLPS